MVCVVASVVFVAAAGSPLTIAGPDAQVKTVGHEQGAAWNLFSYGEWGDFVQFTEPGAYEVRVRCYGSPADGVWPEMAFVVDGAWREQVTVDSSETKEVAFSIDAEARAYRLTVAFLNDARTDAEDRNLYLESMSITPAADAPAPVVTTEEEWRVTWSVEQQRLEEETLARAAEAIETNRKRDVVVRVTDAAGQPAAGVPIALELTRHAFLFGCNIYMFDQYGIPERNEPYKERFRELFNYATVPFYWQSYEWERGKPNYEYTDRIIAWCRENGIRMKGHPLLWQHEAGIPRWSDGQPPEDVQKQRVTDILSRFKGGIEFWEVVNEPSHLPGLTIDAPYQWARETDPDAYLIVNDYQVMADGCPAFFNLLRTAIDNGVPFDGIGIQAHEPRTMRFPLQQAWEILDRYATLGKELHITEFTPASSGDPITGSHVTGVWDEAAQTDYAVKFYTVCFAHPAVRAITWWDLCDHGAWLQGGGLLREDLTPKPAYDALKRLIHEEWTTRIEGETGENGEFRFRGFCGDYHARLANRDEALPFRVERDGENNVQLVLSGISTSL